MPDTLHTPRLRLRRWRPSDLDALAAIEADPRVTELLGGRRTREETAELIARFEAHHDAHGFGMWAVERADPDEPIGSPAGNPPAAPVSQPSVPIGFVGLQWVPFEAHFTPAVEIGWRLASAHWGRGYATEAALRALARADELALAPIVSFTVPANARSRAVMARIGLAHDPTGDFDHPRLPERHPLRRHVLYRRPR